MEHINADAVNHYILITDTEIKRAVQKTGKELAESPSEFRGYMWKTLKDIAAYENEIYELVELRKQLSESGSEELRGDVESTDKMRRSCHNAVIDDFKILNRICDWAGIPAIIPGLEDLERKKIAMAAFEFQEYTARYCY